MSDLSGNWEVQVRFVRGEARHAVQLQQDGEELSGRYRSHFGEHEVRGRVREGEVEMAVGIHYQGVGTRYSFRGKIADNEMQGEVGLGEYWSGNWQARKLD